MVINCTEREKYLFSSVPALSPFAGAQLRFRRRRAGNSKQGARPRAMLDSTVPQHHGQRVPTKDERHLGTRQPQYCVTLSHL